MRTLSLTLAAIASVTLALTTVQAEDTPDYGSGKVRHVEYFGGLRIDVGLAPGLSRLKTSSSTSGNGFPDPAADGTTTLDHKSGFGVNAGIFFDSSLEDGFGWAWTPALFYRQAKGSTPTYTTTLTALGVKVGTGPALTLGPINFELTPYVGFAGTNIKQTASFPGGVTGSRHTGSGLEYDYGLTLTADWLFNNNFYLGLTGGYEAFHSLTHAKYDQSNSGAIFDKQNIQADGHGPVAMLTFGLWF